MYLSKLDWTNWGVAVGTAFVSQQEGETCARHAIGKGIFEFLQKKGFYKGCTDEQLKDKQKIVIGKVLAMHPHNKNAIDPCQFYGKSIHLDDDREKKSLKMEIIRVCRNGKAFADTNQWASFKGDGSNFLIIGCDASYFTGGSTNGTTLHAVFVEDYDVESGTFDCINSWGPEHSAKPKIRDTDESIKSFHAFGVHLVDDKEDEKNSGMKVEVDRNVTSNHT